MIPSSRSLGLRLDYRQSMANRAMFAGIRKVTNPGKDTHISQPSRTRASHALNGGPPSRAKDQSCLELVVTVLTAQEIRRISIKVTNVIVPPVDRVAFRRTSTYGWPVGELIASSKLPRANTSVTALERLLKA